MLGFQEDHDTVDCLLIAQYVHAYGRSSNDLPSILQEILQFLNWLSVLLQCGLLECQPDRRVVGILEIRPLDHHD